MSFIGKMFRVLMSDRLAGDKSVEALMSELAKSKESIANQLASAEDTDGHREKLAHVIGIERWGQSRLKVALGESLKMDEYDGYRPETTKTVSELAEDFSQTRDETLAIAEQLKAIPGVETQTVTHNDMGEMRVRSWLQYLEMHAAFELRRVK
ncbi:MAG: hypothetical protein AAF702_31680 [Chloroflexota bacterium]